MVPATGWIAGVLLVGCLFATVAGECTTPRRRAQRLIHTGVAVCVRETVQRGVFDRATPIIQANREPDTLRCVG